MFALIDCNNFYASCERVFRPDLVGKPIAVLSNNDGCVIARSDEAKELGIPMGAPAFKYDKEFKQKKINVFSSNYALYGDMSKRVMGLLETFTPDIEVYSIDEAFLKFEGYDANFDLKAYMFQIKEEVTQATGIPISIGLAPTKALAKVANTISKKFKAKTKGVHIIDTEEKRLKALKWIPIEKVWGIGRGRQKRLQEMGIKKAFDFTNLSDEWTRKNMSVVGLRLKRDLEGKPSLDLDAVIDKKNIATTRSFDYDYKDYEYIKERIVTFATSCGYKLRKQHSCCHAMLVYIKTNRHKKGELPYYGSTVVTFPYPTNSDIELAKFAEQGLQQIFKEGYSYKKAGVIVMGLTPEENTQINLFDNSDARHKPLMKTIDDLNKKIGNTKLKLASQDLKRTWKMRQERLSPRYTTQIGEVLTIKV